MTSELSIYAARLRDFIAICAAEFPSDGTPFSPAGQNHADAEFNGLALVLFALQYRSNAPYRKFCEARRVTPEQITHWSQIPAMPTAAFKELELTCLPPGERVGVFHSSGTTGQHPSRHFHNAESLATYEASLWPWFRHNVLPQNSPVRLLLLVPPPEQAPHSSLVYMFETVRRKLGVDARGFVGRVSPDGAWELDLGEVTAALENSQREQVPLLLLGTAFSFVHLLDALCVMQREVQLPPGSRVMETGGYKGRSRTMPKAELHALISAQLGVPADGIVCEYGMSELSSQAYERLPGFNGAATRNPSRLFRFPIWARAQIISPETGREVAVGESGLLRVFDLANVFSVMAVQTEDLATRHRDGFELIGRAAASEPRGCSLLAV